MSRASSGSGGIAAIVLAAALAGPAQAQPAPAPPAPVERVTFTEAVQRATTANPSIASAAANILRAEGLLRQARAEALPTITAQGTNTTLNSSRGFEDQQLTPRNTFSASIPIAMPLFAPATWARRAQAEDTRRVAQADAEDVRRQVATAAAQAYLAVIASHRVVEAQQRSRDTAQAFYEDAHRRFLAGASSQLNELRAQQTLSSDQAALEDALLRLYQSQEALGVLLAADRPVDAAEEPSFEVPPEAEVAAAAQLVERRSDIKLFALEVEAARRVVNDSSKEWFPSLTGIFQPEFQEPGSVFTPEAGWRALLQFSVPLFDSGARSGRRVERQAALQQGEATLIGQRRQATSEVRSAYEAVRRSERALQSARDAAAQAARVLEITNISFRAGATTNIEVIDAQRRARDADTAVAVAEDAVRRARLDLLNALGRFP